MRLATLNIDGRKTFGALTSDGLCELTSDRWPDLNAFLANGGLDAELGDLQPTVAIEGAQWCPPIPAPRRIICVGVNYDLHRREMGRDVPEHPVLFVRFPSSLVGHDHPVTKPSVSERYDYEGELAVVIGRTAQRISQADAYDFVAGYSCFLDGSVRDWQRHTSQFTPGKNFDASGSFGPWIVTRDEIIDPHQLHLRTRINGEVLQDASTSQMTFQIPQLIAYISTFTTLEPGDVIATGTPSGVGDKRTPPRYLTAGDRVEIEVENIATLRNTVTDETSG